VLANTPAIFAQDADGMGLVDHEKGAVPLFDLYEGRQFRDVAIHAVDAFNHNEGAAEMGARLFKNLVQSPPVIMRKRKVRCLGELASLENAVVDQGIMHDEVEFAEQMADRGHVGGMPAHKNQAVFRSNQTGNFFLNFTMQWSLA